MYRNVPTRYSVLLAFTFFVTCDVLLVVHVREGQHIYFFYIVLLLVYIILMYCVIFSQ